MGVQKHLERGTVLSKDREDSDPTEHSTVPCATAAVITQRQMSNLRSLASMCVCTDAVRALGCTNCPSGYARDVEVDGESSRGHSFEVCCPFRPTI